MKQYNKSRKSRALFGQGGSILTTPEPARGDSDNNKDHSKSHSPSLDSVLWHCWWGDTNGVGPAKGCALVCCGDDFWSELCTSYSSSCHHNFHHP